MNRLKTIGASLALAGVVAAGGVGIASAAGTHSNTNVGSSGIPRSVFRQERLDAVAEVLNTSTSNVQTARHDHTLKQLITNAGLTKKTFDQKVKAQLTSDLEAKGYSQSQITIALQHRTIVRLHYHLAKMH